ncbi:MAG: Rieske (2Fe-2S) protein [Deltaproteobacteria bacterium]|nr:Rieske (2Fe-2S) protein [Deltaproteobacteria bacterium]
MSRSGQPNDLPSATRRAWLRSAGWVGVWALIGGWSVAGARFFFPRVLFEPSPVFKASYPYEYGIGKVSTKYQESNSVWIVREADGFFALLAVCTHLGCTPVWMEGEGKFKCPCHGSGFDREGINYEGPAPRPLDRVKISLAEDGQLLIDKGITFRYDRDEWGKPGSFLKV